MLRSYVSFVSASWKRGAEHLLLDAMLTLFKERGWLKARGRKPPDSTHVLAKIRALNRLVCVGETLRAALNSLAIVAPDWLLEHSPMEWVKRYGHRVEGTQFPTSQAEQHAVAELIGKDGAALLSDVFDPAAPDWLRRVPAVEILRQVWIQNYLYVDGELHWRTNDNIPPPAQFLDSPYDPEARYSKKRSTMWVGYKVHLTETCDADLPHLITQVATTPAPTTDDTMTMPMYEDLKQHELLPGQHWLDSGSITAKTLVRAQQDLGVQIIGPTRANYKWQASHSPGFDSSHFVIDWQSKQAICPAGQRSSSWTPAVDRKHNAVVKIKFSKRDCGRCPSQSQCTNSSPPRRTLTIRPQEHYLALQHARERQGLASRSSQYAVRQGIEGTISQGVRAFGMRRSRYIGLSKTHLQMVAIAAAINVGRCIAWLTGEEPEHTRVSAFARLFS
jgi:transposase